MSSVSSRTSPLPNNEPSPLQPIVQPIMNGPTSEKVNAHSEICKMYVILIFKKIDNFHKL